MNVLVVMVDQLVPFLTSPYGDPVVHTPAMQRLAGEGVRFDAAYTPYPLCSPARASFMTGRYASDLGCFDNAAPLASDEPTIAHLLTLAGHESVLSGKMHFVGPDQLHGFARRLTTDVYPASMDWVPSQDEEGIFVRGGHATMYAPPNVGVATWTKFLSYDEETHFRALEYLRERARLQLEDPFFLVVSYHHPHDPFQVTQELWDLYENVDVPIPSWPEDVESTYSAMDRWANDAHGCDDVDLDDPVGLQALRRAYYGLVTYVDRKLGEILDVLDATGQADDTLVVFTSDHGDMLCERRMVQKRCFYEWSSRIPLIVRRPGGPEGTSVAEPVSLLDLLPTLCELVGTEVPVPVDGRSFLGLLDGAREPDRFVLSEYHVEKVRAPCFMARRGNHKLVLVHGHGEQLFDLATDPGEWRDRSGDPAVAGVQQALRALILDRFDPDEIARRGAASVRRREVVRDATARTEVRWDYTPDFDARRKYVR